MGSSIVGFNGGGQTFATSHDKSITITSANMYGSGKSIIEVGDRSDERKLYVTGQPVYDQAEHMFDSERIRLCGRHAKRLLDRLIPRSTNDFSHRAGRIDLSDRLDGLRRRLSSVLTRRWTPALAEAVIGWKCAGFTSARVLRSDSSRRLSVTLR